MNARQIIRNEVNRILALHVLEALFRRCSCGETLTNHRSQLPTIQKAHRLHLADEIAKSLAKAETYAD